MTGAELIAQERKRQIEKEGWTAKHDEQHTAGELALAACCYASPVPLFQLSADSDGGAYRFLDPWPNWWDSEWDKRERQHEDGPVIPNEDLSESNRVRNLIKAGALIAAEIDRLRGGQP